MAKTIRATLSDSLQWLYPDSEIPAKPVRSISFDAPAGAFAEVNILVADADPAAPLSFASEASQEGFGAGVWFRLVDVPVEKNTGPENFAEIDGGPQNKYVTRRAPFRVFDAMEPVRKAFLPRASVVALRFQVAIPADAESGKHTYTLTVEQGGKSHSFTFHIFVYPVDVTIPFSAEAFPYTNWITYADILRCHQLEADSPAYWKMLERYARLMAHGRQTAFLLPLKLIFDEKGGMPVLNRPRLERYVKLFSKAGLYYIEGGHFGGRTGRAWGAATFSTYFGDKLATSAEGNAVIASVGRQLMAVIRENKWGKRWIQHVTDEPIPCNATDYRMFVGMVRRHMPGIRIVDATQAPDMPGSVDIWCPLVNHYQESKEAFDRMKRDCGDKVWYYTCCCPGGKWLNRLLDNELLRPLLLGWGGALYDLDGFLHWGLNYYAKDAFGMSCVPNWGGGTNSLPAGDTHIVYPGKGEPWSSVRFEATRQGFEDLELLRRLKKTAPGKATALIRTLVRSFDDYTADTAVYRQTRARLLRILGRSVRTPYS